MRRRGLFLFVGLALAAGCSSSKSPSVFPSGGASGSPSGAGGGGSSSIVGGGGGGASGGASGASGQAGAGDAQAGAAGASDAGSPVTSDGGGAGTDGGGDAADAKGAAGAPVVVDLTKVAPTAGCGKAPPAALVPGTLVQQTMQTMGVKDANCADSRCGAWSFLREYYVRLPVGYDSSKPYPLVIEGPGCGGKGNDLYDVPVFDSTVIRVGLSPSVDAQAFHATNPGQGCFDDKEGDDSIEWTFYENLHDLLASTLCFDRNRVFAGGNGSGAWLANELGCKYAGDVKHPIRAVTANAGGLPTDAKYVPTCSSQPLPGMWLWQQDDTGEGILFTGQIVALNRALTVSGCTPAGITYSTALGASGALVPFPIGGGNADGTCKRFAGCPALDPIVVCALPGVGHAANDTVVDPGWPVFLQLFSTAPLLTP
ncbi:MAG TPA: hypothetical protein VHL80_18050 [Polyangia bacterium]|nr:hypothetical protein [Polyangia bacterium]